MATGKCSQPPERPDTTELEARMRPGAWSETGFLGMHESLDEVVAQDAQTLDKLQLHYDDLADKLEALLDDVLDMLRQPVTPEGIPRALARQTSFPNLYQPETLPHFDLQNLPDPELGYVIGDLQVFLVCYKGWQECPWGDEAKGSCDFLILNRASGDSVTVPGLMPHLIREHHFFEGYGTSFRTDPARLAKVLGLVNSM